MPQPEDCFAGLATTLSDLARRAEAGYAPVVESLLADGSEDVRNIERTLDGLLDFCFDAEVLRLFRRLCRRYHELDPAAAASYVRAYRDMWDAAPDADP
ncbi:MAG: hypothetical protein U0790_28290 [Isosphaeraceae bacterium]